MVLPIARLDYLLNQELTLQKRENRMKQALILQLRRIQIQSNFHFRSLARYISHRLPVISLLGIQCATSVLAWFWKFFLAHAGSAKPAVASDCKHCRLTRM